jgi:hypothetical protein
MANNKLRTSKKVKKIGNVKTITRRTKAKIYDIHDNGGTPFTVHIQSSKAEVYDTSGKKIYETSFLNAFIGDNDLRVKGVVPKGKYPGNTILLHVKPNEYVFIGHSIYLFKLKDDKIVKYYSPVGPSDVPYPYAVGEKNTYFMLDMESLPNDCIDLTEDGYTQFYGFGLDKADQKKIEKEKISFSVKMIKKGD